MTIDITLRRDKGSILTNDEADDNFAALKAGAESAQSASGTVVTPTTELPEEDAQTALERLAIPIVGENLLINGDMRVDQNKTTVSAVSPTGSSEYGVDRWAVASGTTPSGSVYVYQVPGDSVSPKAMRFYKFTGTWSGNVWAMQVIESDKCRDLAGRAATLRFRARRGVSFAGTILGSVLTGTGVDEGVAAAASGTWTGHANVTAIAAITPTTAFVDYTGTVDIPIGTREIAIMILSSLTGDTGSVENWAEVTEVEFGIGPVFRKKSYAEQFYDCIRYNYVVYGENIPVASGMAFSTAAAGFPLILPRPMRVTPTFSSSAMYVISTGGGAVPAGSVFSGGIYAPGGVLYVSTTSASGMAAGGATILSVGTPGTIGRMTIRAEL